LTWAPLHRAVTPETEAGLSAAYKLVFSVTVIQSESDADHDLDVWLPDTMLSSSVTKPVVFPPVSHLS
jgi:hypothetical protein